MPYKSEFRKFRRKKIRSDTVHRGQETYNPTSNWWECLGHEPDCWGTSLWPHSKSCSVRIRDMADLAMLLSLVVIAKEHVNAVKTRRSSTYKRGTSHHYSATNICIEQYENATAVRNYSGPLIQRG